MTIPPQSHSVTAIRLTDGGDGSTSAEILFKDGSELHVNADVMYDAAYAEAIVKDGVVEYPVNYEVDRTTGERKALD
jgi:hypothetical protein